MKHIPQSNDVIQFHHIEGGRVVCHFTAFLEISEARWKRLGDGMRNWELALKRAKTIGGKAYKAKWYGGGIVFNTDVTGELNRRIISVRNLSI